MPHAVEIEIMNTELADPLALIPQGRRLDVLPVRLRADNINARPRSRIALLQGHNLLDVAPLIILCRDEVVIKVILSVVKFVLRLLALPALQEGEDDLCVERERPIAAVGLEVADVMQSDFSAHGKPLYLLCDGNRHALHIAVVP